MYPIEEFAAVINPPQAAVLAVGSLAERAVVRDGAVTARQTMRVTLSSDHRVIDGAEAAAVPADLEGAAGESAEARAVTVAASAAIRALEVVDLGTLEYGRALERQEVALEGVRAGGIEKLLLVEHPPVYTIGRGGDEANLRGAPETARCAALSGQPWRGCDVSRPRAARRLSGPIARSGGPRPSPLPSPARGRADPHARRLWDQRDASGRSGPESGSRGARSPRSASAYVAP